ncbi:MAG: PorP/SprF family type IX secretion system membrane protein [Flavobacteriales bacterium]|nr:PorP/SprF family type IX secretion system membrane protein [Flavobacteriales bacterium]
MMHRISYIVLLLSISLLSYSQQEETYTQYIFNQYAQNPAYGGTKPCPDIKFGTRVQWVGFGGGPVTSFFSYNVAVGYKNKTSKSWHGLGVYLVEDRTGTAGQANGFYKSTALYPSYAFHKRLSHRIVASAGFFVGVRSIKSGISQDHSDPAMRPVSRLIFPDLGAGILVYNPEWFF